MAPKSQLEIPAPPAELHGWPWDNSSVSTSTSPNEAPLISIVIPTFNQGHFIEETLRSIILQNYEQLEIIVIDGGSTDSTLQILDRYKDWITYSVSEQDSGQANAINKGLAVAKGEIVKWLNSDDLLLPGALDQLANAYMKNKDRFFVSPVEHFLDGTSKRRIFEPKNVTHRELVQFWSGRVAWNDPGTFYTRRILETVGTIDESYRYSFDYEFVLRVSRLFEVEYLARPAAAFRVHSHSKTVSEGEKFIYETARVSQKYWSDLEKVDRGGFQKYFAVSMFRNGVRNMLRRPGAALSYFGQGFATNVLLSPWWLARWSLGVVAARLRPNKNTDEWGGFGVN